MQRSSQHQRFPAFLGSNAFYVGIGLAIAVWLINPVIGAWVFGDGDFITELLAPGPMELYFRSIVSLVILLSGAVFGHKMALYQEQTAALEAQKTLMQDIINSQPECVKTISADGSLLEMNPAGLDIIEADCIEDVRYASVYDLIAPEHREQFIRFNALVFSGEPASLQYDVLGLKGSRKSVDSHAVPLRDEQGNIIAHLAVTRDVTGFRRSQQELQKFSHAVEQCASMIMITDPDSCITYVNPRMCEVTGYGEEELLGKTPAILRSGAHDTDFYQEMWQQISAGEVWRGKIQNRRKNGDIFWASMVISPVKDEEGRVKHYLSTQEDITDAHALARQMEYQARHCMLTGLVNRHVFEQHLQGLLEQTRLSNSQHAVFFCDIDQFKFINDSFGHAAGDQVLRQVSNLLEQHTRARDVVARLGGDEFALLLENCAPDEADRVAEKLRRAIEEFTFAWESNTFKLTLSIGAVDFDEYSPDIETVLSQADAACYIAKDLGRNRIHRHRGGDDEIARRGEFQWVAKIHQGLEENRFRLYIQDIVALGNSATDYYEVLLRYIDEDGAVVPPGAFLPAAERYGLSAKIDTWVVRRVCQLLSQELDPGISVSVNLSGLSINDAEFLKFVIDCLAEYQIAPRRLCFEITETATITNLNEAARFIKEIKAVGCLFALDDFGSGLSSFGYLRTLPVDAVKIDGVFVKHICSSKVDMAMVRSINEIGHVMGKQTVAEYVEEEETVDLLRAMGVDFAQGFGISKPRPIEELIREYPAGKRIQRAALAASSG